MYHSGVNTLHWCLRLKMTLSLLFKIKSLRGDWFLAERWQLHRNRICHLVITTSLWTVYNFIGSIPFGWLTNKQFYDLLFTPDCKRNETDKTFSSQMLQMLNCYLTATRWSCTLQRKSLGWKIDIFIKETENQSLATAQMLAFREQNSLLSCDPVLQNW